MEQTLELNVSDIIMTMPSKILIVDDEPDIVEEVVEHLEDEGMECVAAYSATQALDFIAADKGIGIVVTDIRMPGMDGLEMARRLTKEYGETRDLFIIVVTGHAGMKEAIEALQLGVEDFLTKPISPDHLLHSVRRAGKMVQLRANERFYQVHLESEVRKKTAEARKLADDLAEQNKELTVVNRLKEEFLQMMSHELNTPLNAIIGFSQLLMESSSKRNDKKGEKCAEHIYSAGIRLTKTFESILMLSSMSAGNLPVQYSRFTAKNFIDSIAADYIALLDQWNAALDCKLPERPFDMNADYLLLHKAVGNLVENAAKYGKQGGKVSLAINPENDFVHFTISDDGPGMTVDQIAIALEPMRQVDGSLGRKIEGMGLGLPLASSVAELHGGNLTINSQPGNGTTVTIIVPAAKKGP
ncbi:MAG: hybrid sensor histidine kinase/response regulator [Rhodospirillales bacterium]|nr:hybrid sensor histidine kinase/response regulator [Rhodospirillales bacterium]